MLTYPSPSIVEKPQVALLKALEGHTDVINALAVLPNGTLVSGSKDRTIRFWNKDGSYLKTLEDNTDAVSRLAVLPDGTLVSGSMDDNAIKLWDNDGHCLKTLRGHSGSISALTVLKDSIIVSGSDDNTIKLWDLQKVGWFSSSYFLTLKGHCGPVSSLAVLPDGTLVSGCWDYMIKHWDLKKVGWFSSGCFQSIIGHADSIAALAVLPDGTLVSGSMDNTIKFWDKSGNCRKILEGHLDSVTALVVLPDGILVSASMDNTIKFWDKAGNCLETLKAHSNGVTAMAVLSDGTLVSGSKNGMIKLWKIQKMRLSNVAAAAKPNAGRVVRPLKEEIKQDLSSEVQGLAPHVSASSRITLTPITPPASPSSLVSSPRSRHPLAYQVNKLLKEAKTFSLTRKEQEELGEMEAYHQHLGITPFTPEVYQKLTRYIARLIKLINDKDKASTASHESKVIEGTEEKMPPRFQTAR